MVRRVVTAALAAATTMLGCSGCSAGFQELEQAATDLPAVKSVHILEEDPGDPLPFSFQTTPKFANVRMDTDATTAEVAAVFDAYREYLEDEDITSLEVKIAGTKGAFVDVAADVPVTDKMIEDLVTFHRDTNVTGYEHEAYSYMPGVTIDLKPSTFEKVAAVAEPFIADEINYVAVESGPFLIIRDTDNGVAGRYEAREAFTLELLQEFDLAGAHVTDRGPLELMVEPEDRRNVRDYVQREAPGSQIGRVRIYTR